MRKFLSTAISSATGGTGPVAGRRPLKVKSVRTNGTTKRFYAESGVEPNEDGKSFVLTLDGRPVLTPGDTLLAVPTRHLCAAIALEWDYQSKHIKPTSMPLTQLAVTSLDQMKAKRIEVLDSLRRFAVTDNLCYQVSQPESLVALQNKHWVPLLQWAEDEYGLSLGTTEHIQSIEHEQHSLQKLWNQVNLMDQWRLAALDQLTGATKSMIVSLALLRNVITVEQAYSAARLHEDWQIRNYGKVEGIYGHGVDMAYVRLQVAAARTFLNLLEPLDAPERADGAPTQDAPLQTPAK